MSAIRIPLSEKLKIMIVDERVLAEQIATLSAQGSPGLQGTVIPTLQELVLRVHTTLLMELFQGLELVVDHDRGFLEISEKRFADAGLEDVPRVAAPNGDPLH